MLNKQKLIFIDITSGYDHNYVKNKAIGASEYQLYNLLENLCNYYDIICYNCKNYTIIIDNIIYKSWKNELINDNIEPNTIVIIQRMFPNINKNIFEKIKNNKIFIWIHDLTSKGVFIFNNENYEKQIYIENDNVFKQEILETIYKNKNIHFIFVSNFIKDVFIEYFNNYKIVLEDNRINIIYNILYENEFIKIKNSNIVVNKNYITYASAWTKGIKKVIDVFDYAVNYDPDLKLVLLSPGYDWTNFTEYTNYLKDKYNDSIIIHGPVNKEEYSKIIRESMVVLTTTFKETFGCVFAETYYLGTPVIADYRSGAVKEIIDNNYIVNFDNKEETLNKILNVKNNRDDIKVELDNKFMFDYNINLWINVLQE
jgi:hypothetical protein